MLRRIVAWIGGLSALGAFTVRLLDWFGRYDLAKDVANRSSGPNMLTFLASVEGQVVIFAAGCVLVFIGISDRFKNQPRHPSPSVTISDYGKHRVSEIISQEASRPHGVRLTLIPIPKREAIYPQRVGMGGLDFYANVYSITIEPVGNEVVESDLVYERVPGLMDDTRITTGHTFKVIPGRPAPETIPIVRIVDCSTMQMPSLGTPLNRADYFACANWHKGTTKEHEVIIRAIANGIPTRLVLRVVPHAGRESVTVIEHATPLESDT